MGSAISTRKSPRTPKNTVVHEEFAVCSLPSASSGYDRTTKCLNHYPSEILQFNKKTARKISNWCKFEMARDLVEKIKKMKYLSLASIAVQNQEYNAREEPEIVMDEDSKQDVK
ncbi:hypothetical protein CRE_26738 [Caenorhabditis remanei]|uniref:Uncharacterized protein n=1 Tax=Caenorhabditis remanei TaxID=31234 RepID=E3MXS4_CAERE|nr:hypothetical protein CRE_26738 [Caenorhabditis remanei]